MLGEVVGSYRVIQALGEGGMGLVFSAEHETLGKRAAIKILRAEYSQNADIVRRFFNEARATSQIRHPGLIDIYDFGRLPSGDAYIVMELLEGESLAELLRRQGPLPEHLAIQLTSQIASALGAAHQRGVIHRDLKPANIFLVKDSAVPYGIRSKVLDFGVAKLTEAIAGPGVRTRAGALLGTPTYMAPEQCRGVSDLDHRADIYSLGCVMYQMIAGRPPFMGEASGDVIAAHIFDTPVALETLVPGVSAAFAMITARCLSKSPEERYANMIDLGVAVIALANGGGMATEHPTRPSNEIIGDSRRDRRDTTLSHSASAAITIVQKPHAARGRGVALAGASVLVAALGVGAVRLSRPHEAQPAPTAPVSPPPTMRVQALTAVQAPAPAPLKTVRMSVESEPAGADVIRVADGVRLGTTPWQVEMPRAATPTQVLLRRNGYQEEQMALSTTSDRSVFVRLVRERKLRREAVRATAVETAPAPVATPAIQPHPDAIPIIRKDSAKDLKNPFE